jgi:alkylation response protein AidB-like acyl-CoA dehydrogenase
MSDTADATQTRMSDSDGNEIETLRASVANFARRELSVAHARGLRDKAQGFDRGIWKKMAEQGWVGVRIPEQLGGSGLGSTETRVIAEELAAVLAPEPFTACAVLAAGVLLYGSNGGLKNRLLPRLAAGELIVAPALQETTGGWNDEAIQTTVRTTGKRRLLTGVKRFVVTAEQADGYIVSAQEDGKLALYWVPADASGIARQAERRADGSYVSIITFADVDVQADQLIAHAAEAAHALEKAFNETTLVVAAELSGVMSRALTLTLDYMKTRVQFGKAIGSFQALQHRAVDLFIQKELALGALDEAVRAFDDGATPEDQALIASRIKSRCADAAMLITREAIKLHGAIGFADECDIGLYLQRALVLSAWLGNAAWHRRRYSALIVDRPAEPSEAIASTRGQVTESPKGTDFDNMRDDAFRAEVRSYFEQHYPDHLRYLNRRASWAETGEWAGVMSSKGWIAPSWPREHGGMGLSPAKLIIYMEEQERWGVARAPDQGILMVGPLLLRFGTDAQRRTYLPPIIACEHIWSQGYSEPNAGSDLAGLSTRAVAENDEYVINGTKIWSTLAQDATHMFLLARTDNTGKKQEGISFFLLDLSTPGVRIRPIRNIEGHEEFCEVFFDNVRIPKDNLVGELNQGWTIAKTLLGFERLNHGSPRRAQYPLRKVQAIARQAGFWTDSEFQTKYVKLRMDVEDLASSYSRYADIIRSGRNPGPSISFLKIWATETFQRLAELLIEVAGDAGSLRGEVPFGLEKVDVLGPYYGVFPATIAAGSNDIQRNIIARHVLDLPR